MSLQAKDYQVCIQADGSCLEAKEVVAVRVDSDMVYFVGAGDSGVRLAVDRSQLRWYQPIR